MDKTKCKCFEEYLRKGDLDGVRNNLELDFLDKVILQGCQWKPIHIACWHGYRDIVKLLIDANCDIECEDTWKKRPIHIACQGQNVEIIKLLIAKKCDIESETLDNWRPIHYACLRGHIEIVQLLINQKCNIEIEDACKNRPIYYACFRGHIEIVKLLIEQQCEVETTNNLGQMPLDVAKSKHRNGIVKILEETMEIRKQTRDSIINNDEKTFTRLYSHGKILAKDPSSRRKLLEMALERKADKIVKILFDDQFDGALINWKNEKNQTLLQVAIETEAMEMIQYLIFETEDLDNEDCEGRTALLQLFMKISYDNNSDKPLYSGFLNAIKTIISEGGNIYHDMQGDPIIRFCTQPDKRKEIERIFKKRQKRMNLERKVKIVKIVEKKICEICMDNEIDSVLDCGHTICQSCGEQLKQCPFCGFKPVRTKRIYFL